MIDFENKFIWNDGMCIDNNVVWFVGCQINALFKLKMNTGEIRLVKKFPDLNIINFRKLSICRKYKTYIYCFPDIGNKIWIYDILHDSLDKMELMPFEYVRQGIMNAFLQGNHFFAVSITQKQIIEIDAENRKIIDYYSIFENAEEKLGWECIEVEGKVYCVSNVSNTVCEFDMKKRSTHYYDIPVHNSEGFNTICFTGGKFWLSGNEKDFVIWDRDDAEVNVLNNEIDDFYAYRIGQSESRQLFLSSVDMQEEIWFIPYLANKILYVDKKSLVVRSFEIEEEIEKEEDMLQRSMRHKYILERVSEGRFIWLYSFKNEKVIEIDTAKLNVKTMKIELCEESKDELWKYWIMETNGLVSEINKNSIDRLLRKLLQKEKHVRTFETKIGENIHKRVMSTSR